MVHDVSQASGIVVHTFVYFSRVGYASAGSDIGNHDQTLERDDSGTVCEKRQTTSNIAAYPYTTHRVGRVLLYFVSCWKRRSVRKHL